MVPIRSCLVAASLALNTHAADLTAKETTDLLARIAAARPPAAQADFTESRRVALLANPITERGTLAIAKPNLIRREVHNGPVTICDGTTLAIHFPDTNEIERYPIAESRPIAELVKAMTVGLQLTNLEKSFTVHARREPDGFLLTLTPRSSLRRSIRTITVSLANTLEPRTIHITHANGDTTTTKLTNHRPLTTNKPNPFQIP